MVPIIKTNNLYKCFPGKKSPIKAVNGVNLEVAAGTIFGFLGPNGAGKTTVLRLLTTLMPADRGDIIIAGHNLKTEPQKVRSKIGYVAQMSGCIREATAYENLMLQARLYGMNSKSAKHEINKLTDVLALASFLHRKARTLSGGQLRRVDLAMGMIHSPEVLFLDEPTNGLDPQSRAFLWREIVTLKTLGLTIFTSSHYLDEVDHVCDQISIIDHGSIVASGTSSELKRQISGDVLTLQIGEEADQLEQVINYLKNKPYVKSFSANENTLKINLDAGQGILQEIIESVSFLNLTIKNLNLTQPSLDEVFLTKTGLALRES